VKILVVDDEAALCAVLDDLLDMEGYDVETCGSAPEAREKLEASGFDIALVDVFLSDRPEGIELAGQILSGHPETQLIFMTGYAEESDIRDGYASGAYGCIRKPFMLDDVVRIVGKAADERRQGIGSRE
jgi:two-component system, NtrC family, response regulator HydG